MRMQQDFLSRATLYNRWMVKWEVVENVFVRKSRPNEKPLTFVRGFYILAPRVGLEPTT